MVWLLVLTLVHLPGQSGEGPPDRTELDAQYAAQLESLAAKCDELKLPELAEKTRAWRVSAPPDRNLLYIAPDADPLAIDDSATELTKFWHQRLTQLREAQALRLFALAREQLDAGFAPMAYQTLHEVLRENPNHGEARRILGYRQTDSGWRRPGTTTKVTQPRLAHARLEWPGGSYWQIETPHFEVTTNLSEAEGLELGEELELVYTAWEQLFFSFWSSPRQLASYFEGGTPSASRRKFKVVYFKNRAEYVGYLEKTEPRIGMTQGIYLFDQQQVFLFHDAEAKETAAHDLRPNWYHEVVHQLFQEYRAAPGDVGVNANFWLVEGVALYFESLRPFEGYVTLGGIDARRLQFARNRKLVGDFYVPLEELTALSRRELQRDERINAIYSQAAGLTHFLIDGDNGNLREPMIQYLQLIYRKRDDPHSLEKTLGVPPEELDQRYARFLEVNDSDILALPENLPTTDLALARTAVTDKALHRIGQLKKLRWLDLTGTRVTDQGIAELAELDDLNDLSLAATVMTDASLPTISKLTNLEELDLSGTRVTDEGLRHLKDLSELKILRLAATRIGDAGLAHLANCRKLQMVDLRQTRVSPQAVERLRQAVPGVEIHTAGP